MQLIDFILHIDQYLEAMIALFGAWTYVILFAIIFAETGLVVTPFLPGDSLLFAVGTFAGGGFLDIWIVYVVMLVAAVLGDTVNYWAGYLIGPRVFARENARFFKKEYLDKTQAFYEKYGGKTIIIARFVPIVRTFAPFVAGVGKMRYNTFLLYNVVGAFVWVTSLTFAGYYFGGLPFVKANFEYVVMGIILLSLLPMAVEYLRARFGTRPVELTARKAATYEEIEEVFKKQRLDG